MACCGRDPDKQQDKTPTGQSFQSRARDHLTFQRERQQAEVREDEIFSKLSKLYRFDGKTWEDHGLGEAKLLRDKKTSKVRLMMQQEKTMKVLCNHLVVRAPPYCDLLPAANGDPCWVWTAQDFADDGMKVERFAMKFNTFENARAFKDAFEYAKQEGSISDQTRDFKQNSENTKKSLWGATEGPQETKVCAACGLKVVNKFCTRCGTPIGATMKEERVCVDGHCMRMGANFCTKCGKTQKGLVEPRIMDGKPYTFQMFIRWNLNKGCHVNQSNFESLQPIRTGMSVGAEASSMDGAASLIGLPLACFFVAVALGTVVSGSKPEPGHEVKELHLSQLEADLIAQLDKTIRTCGSLLPLLVFAFRFCLLRSPMGERPPWSWLPECCGWNSILLLVWIGIALFRLLSYLSVKAYHYWFSDHAWLISSLIAMLQMEFALLSFGLENSRTHGQWWRCRVAIVPGWVFFLLLLIESYITARFYHTGQAMWTAALVGLCFQLPVLWWLHILNTSCRRPIAESSGCREPLLESSILNAAI